MKRLYNLWIVLMLSVLALGGVLPYAQAHVVYNTRGITLDVRSADGSSLSFKGPGRYHLTILVILYTPWWWADFDTYSSVTLNITLARYGIITYGQSPVLDTGGRCGTLDDQRQGWTPNDGTQYCTWTNVHVSADEDGVTIGSALYLDVDLVVDSHTGGGVYWLRLDAAATGPEVWFEGHSFTAIRVLPS